MTLIRRTIVTALAATSLAGLAGCGLSSQETADKLTYKSERGQADDANAESLLVNGAVSMEAGFADRGSYAIPVAALQALEPNISWVAGGTASAATNQVAVSGDAGGFTLASTTPAGKTFLYSKRDGAVSRTCGAGCTW